MTPSRIAALRAMCEKHSWPVDEPIEDALRIVETRDAFREALDEIERLRGIVGDAVRVNASGRFDTHGQYCPQCGANFYPTAEAHKPECWLTRARAALKEDEGDNG